MAYSSTKLFSSRGSHAPSLWAGYLFACVVTVLMLVLRLTFLSSLLGNEEPFHHFFLSITIAAWYGGLPAGLMATATGGLAAIYYFIEPVHSFQLGHRSDWLGVLVYALVGVLISYLSETLGHARIRLDNERAQLRQEVIEREKVQNALVEADRRKDGFLAMLAHELRNPLAPISNALSILKLSEDKAVQKKALATIGRQVEQMVHLVDDLVDVARITQNKIELRKKPVRIDEALKSAIETVRPLLNKKKHLLSVNLPSDAIWVNGDLTRLSQIFANLLTNAAKFTEAGGRIELTARLEGSEVAVIVHDNGIGISPFVLPRIFNMFAQRGQMEPAEDALGIGLSLATTLAKLHGGRISAYSPGLGQGSEFTVRLPVLSEAPVPAAVPETSTLKKSSRRYRMLVVDDNEASAKTLAWTLELMGHDVRVAHDGLRAIEIAESFLPEVILLDIGLPGMNGFELCKSLRRIPRIRNSLYIAQTGWGQEEHKRRSKEVGFDYHLVKPVDIEALQSLLESAHLPA